MWNSSSQYSALATQEVADLVAAEVEHERAPVGLLAPARVGVLVQRAAVEPGQRPGVLREVRGHPVHDHADAPLVQVVDEVAEVVRRAESRRRRVVRRDLVAPRAAERVLRHRQQLDVREPELDDVIAQLLGELPVVQPGPPRAEVHLVDAASAPRRHCGRLALGDPLVVVPGVVRSGHDRRRRGRRSVANAIGSAFSCQVPSLAEHPELVAGAGGDAGHEQLPDARRAERAHRVPAAVPAVEVAASRGRRGAFGAQTANDVPSTAPSGVS